MIGPNIWYQGSPSIFTSRETLFPFTVLSGDAYQLKSFVVTVLGGLGNPAGALIGGIALGLFEGLTTPFMPVSWTLVFEFVLFVVVLIAFPGGLLNFRWSRRVG